ncbi:DUF3014 domain-containing protein [Hydrogenophaga sp.]|uniref:DUF3014 domain-containing protein n=1 Tax=Hydrogenophaga sp. TaxID=1904254 RepID=UPI003D0C8422
MTQRRQTSRIPAFLIALGVVVALIVAGYLGWQRFKPREELAATAPVDMPAVQPTPIAPEVPPAPSPPPIEHPVEAPVAEEGAGQQAPMPALADADAYVTERLTELLTRKNVLTFLQLDGFVRRAVATVDNLARPQAPVMVWPVNPTPQRFSTQRSADGATETIHPDNAKRYAPFVALVESVDSAKAVVLYRRLYPLFQQAYEELGFPGRYFNDRLVQVLDHLIATPVRNEPLAVSLVEVKGEVPSTRPWVRYEFADPSLEGLSAGQKILLRVGPENHRRLQAKLVDIRGRVARR